MKRFFVLVLSVFLFSSLAFSQSPFSYARRIQPYAALPATCNPANGDVVMLTAGAGISPGVYNCTATNTWRPIGVISNGYLINQGTLTASTPAFSHTATWNNGAVTFVNIISNITNTASNALSRLLSLQVGGSEMFSVSVAGAVMSAGSIRIADTAAFGWNTRSSLQSSADGLINLTNNTGTGLTRVSLGVNSIAFPAITVSAAVAGQTQGIIITKGDGTNAAFADLGAATNGSMIYCSNCTVANPCAGAGTGAIAKRLNGVWVCN